MTGQIRSCCISLLCLFAMHVSAGEDPSVVINADNFLCKLRGNINLCKEYRESKKTREYAYFRLAGKYMKVGDFCKLYQSLCSSSKPGDMVSIITIRSKDVKKSHEPKKYMENFTKAIQEYVNQNEGHVSVGSLGLTVGYFELKSLGDYDLVNENFSQICNIRRRCEELVIENAFALCFDAFKDTIFERAASSLGSCNVQEATLLKDPIEYTRFEYCLNVDQEILGYVKESTEKDSFFDKLAWRQNGADSVFGRIYSSMCRHEEKIRCLYFTNNEGELLNFLVYLVKDEYRELFKKISDDIAAIQIPIFEMKKSKERCKLFFADIYSQYIETVRVSKIFTGVRGEYNQLLCFCASKLIVAKFQIFFHSICHDEISDLLYDTYKAKTEKILQEIQSEQITTIVYNRQIDSESMYQLCDIIGNRKALDGSYKQQYIYLEDGRAVTQEEAKECCDACDKSALEPGDKEQLVEFYPIKKGVYEDDVESRNYICLRHHAVADYTRGLSYTASPTKPKETVITIDAFDKTGLVVASKEKIKSLIDACLARDHCKLVNAHVVNVLNGIGTILIHIVQYEKNDTALKKVLLIYDMPISNDVKNSTNLKYSNRRIIPRENVPDSSLHDLYHYLQFLQMITHSEFRILSSRYLKYMSFGKISDQNGDAAIYDLYSKVDCDAYNNCRSLENKLFPEWIRMQRILPFHISIWNITEFDHFLCTCGMDIAKFKWILCKLINNVCIKVDKLKQNFIVTGISPNRIKLILTLLRDNSVNLHICETVERCPTQSIVLNPLNILAKTKDFTRDSLTFGILDRIMRFINCETSLRAHIVTYMCEHYKHPKKRYAKGEKPNSAKKDCFRFILQQIDGIFTKAQNMIDGCCDMKDFVAEDCYLPDLQKAIDAKEIMQLVERIEREISVLRRRKKMKVTAVQIRKMTGGRLFAFYRYEETKVVEETSE